MLNQEQQELFNLLLSGTNIFITGSGGCGKTYVIKKFVEYYKENIENNKSKLYVTSTTGTSALLLNGMTIHSYCGIGLGDKDIKYYIYKFNQKRYSYIKNRWLNTKVLIIDEISMMNPELFQKIDTIAQYIRKNNNPFGGMQLIVSGDFCQLPPIDCNKYCFEANNWNECIKINFYLHKNMRMNTEDNENKQFIKLLENIRLGNINDEDKELLNKCVNKKIDDLYDITPTILFSKKKNVQDYNKTKLQELLINNYETKTFESTITYSKKITEEQEKIYRDKINKTYNIDDYLILTINTQIMLTINKLDENLSNGSRGIIIGFNPYPIIQFYNGIITTIYPNEWIFEEDNNIITKKQLPLIHAWSITIHKSQGMSIDCLITDIGSSIFECGQIYVALSRVKNIKYLSIKKIDYSKIKINNKILNFYKNLV